MKIKIKSYLSFFFVLSACLIFYPAITDAKGLTSIELIENAYRSGKINYEQAINYKVSAVIRQDNLPDEFKSKAPIKSATTVMMEARANRHLLYTANSVYLSGIRGNAVSSLYNNKREHNNILNRDLRDNDGSPLYENISILQSIVSPARHFRIHYTTENTNCNPNIVGSCDAVPTDDINNNNIPDYVENFADILDYVWKKQIEELGYDAPPSDGTEGGDCLLDVYLADLGAYGYTQIDTDMPVSTVYLILENDFDGFYSSQVDSMKVTAAHEFFHTIQFQISDDIALLGWWMEASATWMEDEIYPDTNDYVNYLDRWFPYPELPLYTFNDTFQYGTSVWVKHMTEKYGSKLVFDIWDNIKNGYPSAITAIEKVLSNNNSSLTEELKELRSANLTYTYADGPVYKSWPTPVAVSFNPDSPFFINDPPKTLFENFSGTNEIIQESLYPLSAQYYAFTPPADGGVLNFSFSGDDSIYVMVIGFKSSNTDYDITELLVDSVSHTGAIAINEFNSNGYTRVVIIPLNSGSTLKDFTITASYSVSTPLNASSIEIKPSTASLIAEDAGYGKRGSQQFYAIMNDVNNNQILKSSTVWVSNSALLNINSNGFAIVSGAVTNITATAWLGSLSSTASLSAGNPASMIAGTPRSCDTSNLSNSTTIISNKNNTNTSDKRCFIATAAFGSSLHPYVEILREFRNKYLLTNSAGKYFVSIYYYYSPYLAKTIEKNIILKTIVKISLIPAIMFSSFMVKTTLAGKTVVGILFSAIIFVYIKKLFHPKLSLKNAQVQGRTRI